MKITKAQLRKIIKEELEEAIGANIPGKEATLDFLRDELGSWQLEAVERLKSVLETERFDLTEEVLDIIGQWGPSDKIEDSDVWLEGKQKTK
jgi:hypothetical protein